MQQTQFFPFVGGENLSQPAITLKAGELLTSSNYECVTTGGYRRVEGYERFDGRIAPSEAQFTLVRFESGTVEPVVNSVLNGATSGATALVRFVVVETGSFVGGDATGFFILTYKAGDFLAGELLQDGITPVATNLNGQALSTGNDTDDDTYKIDAIEYARSQITEVPGSGPVRGVFYFQNTVFAFRDNAGATAAAMYKSSPTGWQLVTTPVLQPGGRYEFVEYNFGGSSGTKKIYGVSGENKAFEFDGTTYTEITTGMVDDRPTHVAAFKKYLFLSFRGGSLQNSPLGDPVGTWTPLTGASEIGTGDEIVGLLTLQGDTLAVFNRSRLYLLQGSAPSNFNLVEFSDESGAVEWTIQRLGGGMFLDDKGLTTLNAVQAFGDFNAASISQKINRKLITMIPRAVSSVRIKSRDQYQLFFDDGTGLCATYSGQTLIGFTSLNYKDTFYCTYNGEGSDGVERVFMGATNGFVYEYNKGFSMDGLPLISIIRLAFNHVGSPAYNKRFFKVIIELEGGRKVTLKFTADYSYGDLKTPSSLEQNFEISGSGGFWDVGTWDEIIWDGQPVSTAEAYLNGIGKNMSLFLYNAETYEAPHTLQGAIIHYSGRGLAR